jgi:hypothetical protein
MQNSNTLSESFDYDKNFRSPRKEGLTDKLRQKINTVGKRVQPSRENNDSELDLTHLTARSQVRYNKNKELFSRN